MADPRWPYRPLLDLIGKAEGTDRGRGYNETLGYGAYTGGAVNLVGMTLGEIDALQTRMLRHPANKLNSSAAGRYQIVRTTLRSIKKRLGLKDGERFDAAMQDRLGCFLLGDRGVDRMLAGKMSEDAFVNALAREWASFPTTTGKGYYKGQGTGVTLGQVRAAIAAVRERARGPAPVPTPPPPPPPPVEPPAPDPHAIIDELRDLLDRLDAALAARSAAFSPAARLAAVAAPATIVHQPQETTMTAATPAPIRPVADTGQGAASFTLVVTGVLSAFGVEASMETVEFVANGLVTLFPQIGTVAGGIALAIGPARRVMAWLRQRQAA